jgi:hypothetical protein
MHPEIPRPDVAAQRGRCLRRRARGPPSRSCYGGSRCSPARWG